MGLQAPPAARRTAPRARRAGECFSSPFFALLSPSLPLSLSRSHSHSPSLPLSLSPSLPLSLSPSLALALALAHTHPLYHSHQAAVKKCVKESTKLLTDWNQQPASFIGKTCKVYWDGDRQWFYARIIYYDANHGRHYVYYLADATGEWLVIQDETIMIAGDLCVVKKGSAVWPAVQYWLSPSARTILAKSKSYKKGCEYVEYFGETPAAKRDYAFLQNR